MKGKHRFSFKAPSLGELTPSAERRSLSLSFEPEAIHALIDLVEVVLASLSGLRSASISSACPFQVQDHGASTFPVSALDARDREPLHGEKRHDRLRPHSLVAPWGSLIRSDREPRSRRYWLLRVVCRPSLSCQESIN